MRLEKAYIEILSGARTGSREVVLFNPAEYSFEKGNAYKVTPVPGLGSPLIQFVNGEASQLSMELFLDDYTDPNGPPGGPGNADGRSVEERLRDISALLDIDRKLHAPPVVRFVWGPLRFDAVIEKIARKVTLFRPDGFPARATLSVTFREYRPLSHDLDNPRRESADRTKRRQITATEDIWSLADSEYGDVRAWRAIAEESDVDDPRSLRPGVWLRLPPWEGVNGLRRPI